MSQTRTRWPSESERQRIEEAIKGRWDGRPEGMSRFKLIFKEDQTGNPAVYIELYADRGLEPTRENIEKLNDFVQTIVDEILAQDIDYWPYVRTLIGE